MPDIWVEFDDALMRRTRENLSRERITMDDYIAALALVDLANDEDTEQPAAENDRPT
jgi:hypothetical protein